MHSHLPTICVSLAVCAFGVIGCQKIEPRGVEPMSDTPLVIDEATQKRDFPKTEAMYPNGAVVAGPTWETWEPRPDQSYQVNALAETPIFVGNLIMGPYQMFRQHPGTAVTFPGATVEPTYNAMPVLPESPSPQPQSQGPADVSPDNTANAKP